MKNKLSVIKLENEDKCNSMLAKINVNNNIIQIGVDTGASTTIMPLNSYV